jgi:hypothetical protein
LLYVVNAIQAASEGHGCVVNGRHLRCEHGLDLVSGLDPLHYRERKVKVALQGLLRSTSARRRIPTTPYNLPSS